MCKNLNNRTNEGVTVEDAINKGVRISILHSSSSSPCKKYRHILIRRHRYIFSISCAVQGIFSIFIFVVIFVYKKDEENHQQASNEK
jgi:hypothetical protein